MNYFNTPPAVEPLSTLNIGGQQFWIEPDSPSVKRIVEKMRNSQNPPLVQVVEEPAIEENVTNNPEQQIIE